MRKNSDNNLEYARDSSVKHKLFIGITLSEIGGAQKVVYEIISGLSEDKYDISLVTSSDGELIKWTEEINADRNIKIRIIEIPYLVREISPILDLKVFFALLRIIKKGNYDIVHLHSSKMGILGVCAAWISRVPKIIFTVHGWSTNRFQGIIKQKVFGLMERLIGSLCTKVICVSYYDLEKGIKNRWLKRENSCVIHNGINMGKTVGGKLRKEFNIPDDVMIIGTIERLREPKDPIFTIKVFHELLVKGYNIKLIIIGDGPLRKECEKLVHDLNLCGHVLLLGTREDARELLNDFDVFVLFSKWEGLPIVIIEAMFAEKPIVASKVGGIPELIESDANGYLVNQQDFCNAVFYTELLLNNKELRARIGINNRYRAINRFGNQRMIDEYENIYLV